MADKTAIEWTEIQDFPGYRIQNDGSVFTAWKHNGHQPRKLSDDWRKMKPQPDGDGYLGLNLFRGGKPHRRKVHLLVLEAFKEPRPFGLEGCHNDGVKNNCHIDNLRWDTHTGNQADRIKHGTAPRGEKSRVAKLTSENVLSIRTDLASGVQKKAIAKAHGVSPSTISAIARGANWAWL